MKQIFTLVFAVICFTVNAQRTTEREYLYLKNGYKTTVESGLDVIAGYKVSLIRNQTITGSVIKIYQMDRLKDTSIAGYIITMETNGAKLYYGVPTEDGFGRQDFAEVLFDMPDKYARCLAYVMSGLAAYNQGYLIKFKNK